MSKNRLKELEKRRDAAQTLEKMEAQAFRLIAMREQVQAQLNALVQQIAAMRNGAGPDGSPGPEDPQ